jgi:hypothetical protein
MEPLIFISFITFTSMATNIIEKFINERKHNELITEISNLRCEVYIMRKNIETIKTEIERFS